MSGCQVGAARAMRRARDLTAPLLGLLAALTINSLASAAPLVQVVAGSAIVLPGHPVARYTVVTAPGATEMLDPSPNQKIVDSPVTLRLRSLTKHPDYKNWEYEIQWERAPYHTKADNKEYMRIHGGNFPPVLGLAGPMKPWTDPKAPTSAAETTYLKLVPVPYAVLAPPNTQTGFGDTSFKYRVRAREHIKKSNHYGPWTAWRSFFVSRRHRLSFHAKSLPGFKLPASAVHGRLVVPPGPPKILSPGPNLAIVNSPIRLQLRPIGHHADPGQWDFEIEWKRARYNTKADNEEFKRIHGGNFPPVLGIAGPMRSWKDPRVPTSVKETGGVQTVQVPYSLAGPPRTKSGFGDSSFEYLVRAREHRHSSTLYGSWSGWRKFFVSGPRHLAIQPKHVSGFATPPPAHRVH